MPCKMIGYYRVSTKRQGRSGLGLEAQKEAVDAHVKQHGCVLIATYTEIETGKKDDLDNRPELRKAIAHAKRSKATLVVAKLDRLSRSVAVIARMLSEGKVKFVACDNPEANELTIHVLAAVAQHEVRAISQRTKDALAVAKSKGKLLGATLPGAHKLNRAEQIKGALAAAEARRANADEAYEDIQEWMLAQRKEGQSLTAIADALNADGQTTRRGKPWNPMQVKRVLERAERNTK